MDAEKIFAKPAVEGLTVDFSNEEAKILYEVMSKFHTASFAREEASVFINLRKIMERHTIEEIK